MKKWGTQEDQEAMTVDQEGAVENLNLSSVRWSGKRYGRREGSEVIIPFVLEFDGWHDRL